jgi:hypothetical protein
VVPIIEDARERNEQADREQNDLHYRNKQPETNNITQTVLQVELKIIVLILTALYNKI